jgi:hypothetical protein
MTFTPTRELRLEMLSFGPPTFKTKVVLIKYLVLRILALNHQQLEDLTLSCNLQTHHINAAAAEPVAAGTWKLGN